MTGLCRTPVTSQVFPFFLSGIGLEAAKLLVKINPCHRLILVCRTDESGRKARETVLAGLLPGEVESTSIVPMSCDHTKLESVRSFTERLPVVLDDTYDSEKLHAKGIDVLCLNAAVLRKKDSGAIFTEDGLEVTFQTNVLSPFLIACMSDRLMNQGGRVVISTSGLYAYMKLSVEGMIDDQTGNARKGFEMIDGSQFHFKRSYALSKVCNVALALSLQQRLATKNVSVNCFSPGLMLSSGLFRHQSEYDMATSFGHSKAVRMNEKTIAWGGGALAFMALSDDVASRKGMYWSDTDSRKGDGAVYGVDFSPAPISKESIPGECTEELWRLCYQLTEIPHSILK